MYLGNGSSTPDLIADKADGNYLKLSGGTLTGDLTTQNVSLKAGSFINFQRADYNYINIPSGDISALAISQGGASGANSLYVFTPTAFVPYATMMKDLGSSMKLWNNVYANKFIGSLQGNADTAAYIIHNSETEHKQQSLQYYRGPHAIKTDESTVRDWLSPYSTILYGSTIRLNYSDDFFQEMTIDANSYRVFLRKYSSPVAGTYYAWKEFAFTDSTVTNASKLGGQTPSYYQQSSTAFAQRSSLGASTDFNTITKPGAYSDQTGNYNDYKNAPANHYGCLLVAKGTSQYFISQLHIGTNNIVSVRIARDDAASDWSDWTTLANQTSVDELSEKIEENTIIWEFL